MAIATEPNKTVCKPQKVQTYGNLIKKNPLELYNVCSILPSTRVEEKFEHP